jgi:hypothetical protein
MTLGAFLLQIAAASPEPVNLLGPYLVSGAGLLTGGTALWRAAFNAGRFQEFKEQIEKKYEARESFETTVVRQHEFQRLSDHIDRRFDEVSHQLAEIRRLRQEG